MFTSSRKSFFSSTNGDGGTRTYSYSFSRGGPSIGFGKGGLTFSLGGKQHGGDSSSADHDGNVGIRLPFMPGGGGQHSQVIGRTSRKARENAFVDIEDQSYDEITKKCLEEGILFEDPKFPADQSSLFYDENAQGRNIEWKRPKLTHHVSVTSRRQRSDRLRKRSRVDEAKTDK